MTPPRNNFMTQSFEMSTTWGCIGPVIAKWKRAETIPPDDLSFPREVIRMRWISGNAIAFLAAMFLTAGCARDYGPPTHAQVDRVNGRPEGPIVVYDGWGHVETRGTFHNGLKEGTWTYYVSTGNKVVEVSYRNGLKDGPCRMWYGPFIEQGRYAGNLKLELTFQKGQPTGTRRRWYPSGEKDSEMEFQDGRIVRARVWEKSGEELPPPKAMSAAEDAWRKDLKYLGSLDTEIEEGLRNSGAPLSRP